MLRRSAIPRMRARLRCAPRHLLALPVAALLFSFLLLQIQCSDDSPSGPPAQDEFQALAGGGRAVGSDPFAGGPEYSGVADSVPGTPGPWPGPEPDPDEGLRPIVYLYDACGAAPASLVIEDSAAWHAWWDENVACSGSDPGRPAGRGSVFPADSGVVDPDTLIPGWDLPWVDFSQDIVIVVTLEREADYLRTLLIEDVAVTAAGTTVRYLVFHPGEGCSYPGRDSFPTDSVAPSAAVVVPRPVEAPFTWARRDTIYSCSWEPDPDQPLTLYYTDALCELGAGEEVVTTQEDWDAWLETAFACDLDRWESWEDSLIVPGDSIVVPGDPEDPTIPIGFTIPIDFESFAVLILRAGEQDHWGGGIWLTALETSATGTEIEYVVTVPGEDCPPLEGTEWMGDALNPTTAIRVPLPLPEPIVWRRSEQVIACDWGVDSVTVEPDSGTGRP
jgi:hypothetical protein